MSSDVKVNDSPSHFMVLDAVARGMKTADKISKVTRLGKPEVELILNDLTVQLLVVKMKKKGLFRNKIEFTIKETGQRLLDSKKKELEQKAKDIEQAYGKGNTAQLQSLLEADRAWMPMMLFSGLMNVMFFSSMMSFMGLAMNPQESSLTGDAGSAESGTDTSDQEGAVGSESGSDDASGDFEGGGFNGFGDSGMDFGGDFNF